MYLKHKYYGNLFMKYKKRNSQRCFTDGKRSQHFLSIFNICFSFLKRMWAFPKKRVYKGRKKYKIYPEQKQEKKLLGLSNVRYYPLRTDRIRVRRRVNVLISSAWVRCGSRALLLSLRLGTFGVFWMFTWILFTPGDNALLFGEMKWIVVPTVDGHGRVELVDIICLLGRSICIDCAPVRMGLASFVHVLILFGNFPLLFDGFGWLFTITSDCGSLWAEQLWQQIWP